SDLYDERLQILELYDRLGFHAYHLAEHHSTPLGMAPSPSVFLASIAQRTRRLRFGPLVYLLPLYHPLRLAEEIAMLDHLSERGKARDRGRARAFADRAHALWTGRRSGSKRLRGGARGYSARLPARASQP